MGTEFQHKPTLTSQDRLQSLAPEAAKDRYQTDFPNELMGVQQTVEENI